MDQHHVQMLASSALRATPRNSRALPAARTTVTTSTTNASERLTQPESPPTTPTQSPPILQSMPYIHDPITPPRHPSDSVRQLAAALTEPAQRVVALFRGRVTGKTSSKAYCVRVSRAELNEALQHIQQQHPRTWRHLQTKERWEYSAGQLRLRMPPARLHDTLSREVARGIDREMGAAVARSGSEAAELVWKSIANTGGSSIMCGDDEYSPDESWSYRGCDVPAFVYEVGWSQGKEQLRDKAENYILDTAGRVRTVLTLDPAYQKKTGESPETTISLLRYSLADGEFEARVDVDAVPIHMGSVVLRLADFIPQYILLEDASLHDLDQAVGDVELSSDFLVQTVQVAHNLHNAKRDVPLPPVMATARPKKRKRASPSPVPSFDSSFESATSDPSFVPGKRTRAVIQDTDTTAPRRSSRISAISPPGEDCSRAKFGALGGGLDLIDHSANG